jgi:hypothetical protein
MTKTDAEALERLADELHPEDDKACPFCQRDPFHYVDVGVGMAPVAVDCCDLGVALLQDGDEQLVKLAGSMKAAADTLRALAAEKRAAVPVDAEREELAKWCLVPRDLEHALMEWVGAISTDDPKQWKIDIAFGRLRQGITGYIQAVADGRATQANAALLRQPAATVVDDSMVERAARAIFDEEHLGMRPEDRGQLWAKLLTNPSVSHAFVVDGCRRLARAALKAALGTEDKPHD